MSTDSAYALNTNIAAVAGVGRRRAEAFRRLGIKSVADLICHVPMRYEHERAEANILAVESGAGDAIVTAAGEVVQVRGGGGRRSRFEAILDDGTGTLLLTWFNAPWMRGKLHPGSRMRVTGKVKRYGEYLQMVNPRWETVSAAAPDAPRDARDRPVYPASEDLSSAHIESAVGVVLDDALAQLDDHLHADYRDARALPTLADAYRTLHRPESADAVPGARRRIAFDELLMLQLGVMLKRRHRRETLASPALRHNKAIDQHICARFPFSLTPSQRTVIDEIAGDLAGTAPMNRLLQGDVGAGKTVVALYAMLLAVASEHQAALMAPTELLAEQHFMSIDAMLEGSNVRIELLTGSLTARRRSEIRAALESGAIDIVIGTHALLTEHANFRSLGVAVIDEQHRFGVHQRATLRTRRPAAGGDGDGGGGGGGDGDGNADAKAADANLIPHTLIMTATPIPRTLSLTVFGDLDVSVIRELPPGRQPVATRRLERRHAAEAYAEVARRIEDEQQAYIVVPVIDESEAGLKDVNSHLAYLEKGPLAGKVLAAVHGRLKREERDEVMLRFRAGEIDALVATTVIEVGVDVPNATVMVIEHAERFGLAQLHQLRGRVGRGSEESVCVLIGNPTTDEGEQRLAAIEATTDGFEIAERDLAIRGPGELFGSRQSGVAPFRVAELPRDMDLLRLARRDAEAWVEENPKLSGERDALLKRRLLKAHGKALGLGDVG